MDRKRSGKLNWSIIYTLLFLITCGIAFGSFAVFGKTFLSSNDGFLQHYPLLIKLRHLMADIVHGKGFHFWQQDIGLGADLIGNMSIIMTDPFNYVAALFPPALMDRGYSVACILRLYVAGISMAAYLHYHQHDRRHIVIGALSYALSSWAVGAINHGFFMLPLILFPLVILGIDKVYDRKRSIVLIFSVAASLITYVYFAYMTAVFALIYSVVRYILGGAGRKKSPADFAAYILQLVVYVAIACCIAAPVLVPMLYTIIHASKSAGMETDMLPTVKELLRYFDSLAFPGEVFGHYSSIGTNALLAMLFPVMIKNRRKTSRLAVVMSAFTLLVVIIPIWGRLMNAFSYRVGRWCYVSTFFYINAAVECLRSYERIDEKDRKTCIIWGLFLLVTGILGRCLFASLALGELFALGWNVLCMGIFLFSYFTEKWVYLMLCLNIGVSYLLVFHPFAGDRMSGYLDIDLPFQQYYEKSLLKAVPGIQKEDNDFFRVDYGEHVTLNKEDLYPYTFTPSNENLYWQAPSLSGYLSTLDERTSLFYRSVGNSASTIRRMCIYSNDNRSRLNFLMGVKYYLYDLKGDEPDSRKLYAGYGYEPYGEKKKVGIQKSTLEPAVGYVFTDAISEKEYLQHTPLECEQLLMNKVVLPDEMVSEFESEDPLIDLDSIQEIEYTVSDSSQLNPEEHSFEVRSSYRKWIINIPEYKNVELYVMVEGLKKEPFSDEEQLLLDLGEEASVYDTVKYQRLHAFDKEAGNFEYYVTKDGFRKRVINAAGEAQGIADHERYLTNIGYFDEVSGDITISFATLGKYTFDSLRVFAVSENDFEQQAETLSQRRLALTVNEGDRMEGTVETEKPGILFLNLGYSPAWRVYVDDEETETFPVDICFTGVKISEGKHTVRLTYYPVGWPYSIVLCMIGLCLTGIIGIRYRGANKS